jgi:hypothetical protein
MSGRLKQEDRDLEAVLGYVQAKILSQKHPTATVRQQLTQTTGVCRALGWNKFISSVCKQGV